jgi:hypothetical protein
VSNVSSSSSCTASGGAVGLYVPTPNSSQLMDAFRQVASSIAHLMQ